MYVQNVRSDLHIGGARLHHGGRTQMHNLFETDGREFATMKSCDDAAIIKIDGTMKAFVDANAEYQSITVGCESINPES